MNQYTSKHCSKCKEEFPATTEYFHRNKRQRDGLQTFCKACSYAVVKASRLANNNAAGRKYSQSPKGKSKISQYNKSDIGKAKSHRTYVKHRHKYLVRVAVSNAIKAGKLQKPTELQCVKCGKQAEQYHHDSYDWDRRLDVTPMCHKCHVAIHYKNL